MHLTQQRSGQLRNLGSYLGNAPAVQALIAEAKRLIELQRVWEKVAPAALARSCKVGHLHEQTLVLHARNGAVAAKASQLRTRLAAELRKKGVGVATIEVEVRPQAWPGEPKPVKTIALSRTGWEKLEELAESLGDSPLRSALLGMLKRQK